MHVDRLEPRADADVVGGWLAQHVADHLRAWTAAVGEPWPDERIAAHVREHGLVDREWKDVLWAAEREPKGFVRVVRDERGAPIGLLWAEERPDRFLMRPVAALCWVYVAPAWRGRGASDLLLSAYSAWSQARGVAAREVYVTGENAPALRLYERHGLAVVDHRLLGRIA